MFLFIKCKRAYYTNAIKVKSIDIIAVPEPLTSETHFIEWIKVKNPRVEAWPITSFLIVDAWNDWFEIFLMSLKIEYSNFAEFQAWVGLRSFFCIMTTSLGYISAEGFAPAINIQTNNSTTICYNRQVLVVSLVCEFNGQSNILTMVQHLLVKNQLVYCIWYQQLE